MAVVFLHIFHRVFHMDLCELFVNMDACGEYWFGAMSQPDNINGQYEARKSNALGLHLCFCRYIMWTLQAAKYFLGVYIRMENI
ncbi:MAG: hypothetical protein LBC21_04935, partial [Oscillospiraceae bacterium]|nr:hypothetical protein [Oscillospiraceae bacterium]